MVAHYIPFFQMVLYLFRLLAVCPSRILFLRLGRRRPTPLLVFTTLFLTLRPGLVTRVRMNYLLPGLNLNLVPLLFRRKNFYQGPHQKTKNQLLTKFLLPLETRKIKLLIHLHVKNVLV